MGDDFYCILKLVSGEEILSLICIDENDGDPIIILQNPVIIKSYSGPTEYYIKVNPWIELANDDFFMIKFDKVITMTETNDERLIKVYTEYMSNDSVKVYTSTGKVKVSNKMGYLSSVEESRKKLEELYKDIK